MSIVIPLTLRNGERDPFKAATAGEGRRGVARWARLLAVVDFVVGGRLL
jgi:hypothetical protein